MFGHEAARFSALLILRFFQQRQRRRPQPAKRDCPAAHLLVILAKRAVLDVMELVLDAPVASQQPGHAPRRVGTYARRAAEKVVVDYR